MNFHKISLTTLVEKIASCFPSDHVYMDRLGIVVYDDHDHFLLISPSEDYKDDDHLSDKFYNWFFDKTGEVWAHNNIYDNLVKVWEWSKKIPLDTYYEDIYNSSGESSFYIFVLRTISRNFNHGNTLQLCAAIDALDLADQHPLEVCDEVNPIIIKELKELGISIF